jgi:hypothetical protein
MKLPFKERTLSMAVVIPSAIIVAALAIGKRIFSAIFLKSAWRCESIPSKTPRAMPANISVASPNGKQSPSTRIWYLISIS